LESHLAYLLSLKDVNENYEKTLNYNFVFPVPGFAQVCRLSKSANKEAGQGNYKSAIADFTQAIAVDNKNAKPIYIAATHTATAKNTESH